MLSQGHSAGAAVIWSHIELFGDRELSKLYTVFRSAYPALESIFDAFAR
jgi:hypothetical protein